MRAKCIAAVSKALGRPLTQVQTKDIEARIIKSMRTLARQDRQKWMGMSAADRLNEAGIHSATELVAEAQRKAANTAANIVAIARMESHVQQRMAAGIQELDAIDSMLAFDSRQNTGGLSIESAAEAISTDATRMLFDTYTTQEPKWFGLVADRLGMQDLVREMHGEATGNPVAAKSAKIWRETTENLRQRFNRSGGDVGQIDDWGVPHHHGQLLVALAAGKNIDGADPRHQAAWVADVLPRLKRDRYVNPDGTFMDDAQMVEFLNEAWLSIATGGANKQTPGQFQSAGGRANRHSQERQIHFKSADDYLAYQEKYGERSFVEVMQSHIHAVSTDIAAVEFAGPNADRNVDFMIDAAAQRAKLANPSKSGDIDARATNIRNIYNVVVGRTQPVANARLAQGFDTLKQWLVASRLGSAVVTAFSDSGTYHLTSKINNLPQMQAFANELRALNVLDKTEEQLANRAGLGLRVITANLNRFGQEGLGKQWASKMATAVIRVQGLNAWTSAHQRAFGATMMDALGSMTRKHADLSALDPMDRRILESKGVTDTDWQVWKASKAEDWGNGNSHVLTPDSIYQIPDATIAHLGDPLVLKQQAVTRLLGHVLEETDMAVIQPGARERAFQTMDTRRGTWKGELVRSVFLFKSFPLAMIFRHFKRGMSQENAGGRAAYLGTLIASTTVLGMASLQVNELLSGRDPKHILPGEKGAGRTWLAAVLKGGSMGLYGDFLFSQQTQYGGGAIAALLGPVVGLAEDAFKLTQGNIMEAAQGKDTHVGAESVKFLRSNLPGANLWYSKAALDHIIFHQLQEYFSPGYLSKMRQRASTEFGQSYWWEPGDVTPDRAPEYQ